MLSALLVVLGAVNAGLAFGSNGEEVMSVELAVRALGMLCAPWSVAGWFHWPDDEVCGASLYWRDALG